MSSQEDEPKQITEAQPKSQPESQPEVQPQSPPPPAPPPESPHFIPTPLQGRSLLLPVEEVKKYGDLKRKSLAEQEATVRTYITNIVKDSIDRVDEGIKHHGGGMIKYPDYNDLSGEDNSDEKAS